MPEPDSKQLKFIDRLASRISADLTWAGHEGMDGRLVFYVVQSFAVGLSRAVEERFGPAEVAEIQRAAFEQRALQVHAIPLRGR